MRFILAAAALALAVTVFTGCGRIADKRNEHKPSPSADLTYLSERGRIIIGVTDFAPIDLPKDGTWEGFDAELAVLFAESLGIAAEFREIDWDRKTELLETGDIDLIWNGMTRTEELAEKITCSEPYLLNAQVIVMQKSDFEKYTSEKECSHLLFACENGSAAEALLTEKKYRIIGCGSQKNALSAVSEGRTDAAAVDMIMAAHMTSSGGEFPDLSFAYPMDEEQICVGMRKGSALEEKVNAFLGEKTADGTLARIAEKYGLGEALAVQQ